MQSILFYLKEKIKWIKKLKPIIQWFDSNHWFELVIQVNEISYSNHVDRTQILIFKWIFYSNEPLAWFESSLLLIRVRKAYDSNHTDSEKS